ncbi:hypothetical protein SAMN04489844_3957 [Nocardioides exalbidus]|uniref:Uncharacterized protein n=1 Tax=Nocardioides exalbidus TaxID=402596 RepID=A0A1H4YZA9_9ACTN|nr:hypothetical protein [Nocardioides exalbidus]SED22534.1 hypothetical protein SAMN04489844_3957 [Nocardioides exalbidus]
MEPDVDPTSESGALDPGDVEFDHEELRVFWDLARYHAKLNAAPTYFGPTTLESVPPPAWAFGESAEESDAFVEHVLDDELGSTTATVADYGDELPETGVLSILCDGSGAPRALVEVSDVAISGDEVVESFKVVYQPRTLVGWPCGRVLAWPSG